MNKAKSYLGLTDRNYVNNIDIALGKLLQGIEARIMSLFLQNLRAGRTIFSHGLVHDAIFTEKSIGEAAVQRAFHEAAVACGFPDLTIARKDWHSLQAELQAFLVDMQPPYDPQKPIKQQQCREARRTRGQLPMTAFLGKLPKHAYHE